MYADLLRATLDSDAASAAMPTEELARAVLGRRVARASGRPGAGPLDVAAAVADELQYDALLVQLCRRVGIDVDLGEFGRPATERHRLEESLVSRGLLPPIGEVDADGVEPPPPARGGGSPARRAR